MRITRNAGRASLWIVIALALAAVAFLLIADPLGLLSSGKDRDGASGADGSELAASGAQRDAAPTRGKEAVSLAGLYGAGDLGGVRLRLLDAGTKKPRVGQAVVLKSRGGAETPLATDPDGVALFKKVAPGRGWRVVIEGEGFRAVTLEGVAVKPAATTDLGDVWLGQNVVLRGRVIDPAGKPVPLASVAAYAPQANAPAKGFLVFLVEQALAVPTPKEQVKTDEDGWFRFTTLTDGTYSLVARRAGFAMRQQDEVVVSARSGSSPLVLRLGEGARMSGKVTDTDGKPIVGARVIALRDLGQRFSLTGNLERDDVASDARGNYVLDTLVDGATYRFGVVAEGYAGSFDQSRTEIERKSERDFTLSKGGFLEGRVTDGETGAAVADASVTVIVGRINFGGMGGGRGGGGRGGRGAAAGAPAPQEQADPTTPALARTDAQGRFRIGPVLPGPVMSGIVKAPGFTSYSATSWTGNAWPDVTLDAPVQVEVVLVRGGRIEGVVRTPEGQPIAAASVVAAAGGMQAMLSMFGGSPSGETDAEGRYRIDGVAPGEYHLTAVAPGFAPAEAGDVSTKAAVPEQGGTVALDLVLSPAGVVSGVVVDGKGEPVPGARVRTRASLGNLMGGGRGGAGGAGGLPANTGARVLAALRTAADLTDPEGRFRLEGVSPGMDWTVEAEAEDFVPVQSEKLRLKAGETKELKLVLVGGATLSGYVVGEGGGRVAGARIRIGTLEPEEAARPFLSAWQADRMLDARVFVSDDEGRFLIPNVKPGRVAVKAEHADWVTSFKRNLSLAPDEVRENHAILLARGEVAEGVVRSADGRPIENALVVVTSLRNPGPADTGSGEGGESVEPAMNGRTDRDGKFKVENIPPGTWSVVVGFAPGYASWFGGQDESAIVRDVSVPAHGVEFRLKAQEMPAFPMGGGPRPAPVVPLPPRPPGSGGGAGGVR